MKIDKKDLLEIWDIHCKGKYPREFGAPTGKNKEHFYRNARISDAEVLYNFVNMWNFEDTYISVYAFREWHEVSDVRKQTARIDTLFLDFDHEEDPRIAFLEAKKLVKYLMEKKNIIPRVYFSGSKGFHVYIDFPEVDVFFKRDTLLAIANRFVNKLKLTTIDTQVIEPARISRIPLTVNSKTGYRCTPIKPQKFIELDYATLIHFCKYGYHVPEIHESEEFADYVRRMDVLKIVSSGFLEAKRKCSKGVVFSGGNCNWRKKRIEYYSKVLREKGYLNADPKIVQIHLKNPKADPNNPGSIEHLARVHLVLLMIEEGFTDEQIHEVFKYAKDYDPEKTQYYINYNRKWLENKKKLMQNT